MVELIYTGISPNLCNSENVLCFIVTKNEEYIWHAEAESRLFKVLSTLGYTLCIELLNACNLPHKLQPFIYLKLQLITLFAVSALQIWIRCSMSSQHMVVDK